ncbi:MAG: D-alanyl-D-alanine carboxypeptidase family protein [Gaiellaceae bacterium]
MRLRLLALLGALVLAAPAAAALPAVQARAYVVAEGATGEMLAASAGRRRLPMASITKLMTVLVALERSKLGAGVTVGAESASVPGSSAYLRAGERLTVRDLVEAALIQSANDAAVALADHVGRGSSEHFVVLMNRRARELGLRDTHFARPDGLDAPGHYSTARDLTALGRVVMNKPFVRRTVRMRSATIAGGRRLATWNDLLATFPGVVGVKTGHTSGAGWCQVAAARGDGVTVYATILGSPSRSQRNADLAALLRWGLSRYRISPVVMTGRVYATVRVPFSRGPVRLVAPRPVRRAVRLGRSLTERVVAPEIAGLPVVKGEELGEVRVYDGRRLIASSPLVAARAVSAPEWATRVGWYTQRAAKNIRGWLP